MVGNRLNLNPAVTNLKSSGSTLILACYIGIFNFLPTVLDITDSLFQKIGHLLAPQGFTFFISTQHWPVFFQAADDI